MIVPNRGNGNAYLPADIVLIKQFRQTRSSYKDIGFEGRIALFLFGNLMSGTITHV